MITIEKTKSVHRPPDFRSISLLWNLEKVLERASVFFYSKVVIPTIGFNQFASQKGICTIDAILSAVNKWMEIFDEKTHSIPAAFLDMSKAFDRMEKSKLLTMLSERGVSRLIVAIVEFSKRPASVLKDGQLQKREPPVKNRTPQGTLPGPMFWLLYYRHSRDHLSYNHQIYRRHHSHQK